MIIVLAIATIGEPFRIAIISNINWLNRFKANNKFTIHIYTINKPFYLISGYRDCVPFLQRYRLRALAKDTTKSKKEIFEILSNINEISADKSNGCVSKGCWVISQEADNQARRYSTINAGQQKGTIHSISGGMDISEWIKNNFKAIPGQQINIVQGVGVTAGPGDGIPLPAPTGEPRVINFSGNSKVLPLKSPNGQEYLSLIIKQLNFDIKIRCNEEIEIHFADLEIKNVNDNFKNFPKPLFPWPQLSIVFSIDSVPVSRGWEYSIGYWMESDNHNLIIQQGSRSICNIAFLGAKDEIILAAPSKTMNFVWNNQKELPPTKIFARVSWRSRLDGTIG